MTFLGTGTSHGVPMIGCECVVCRSSDSRDKRTRASVLIDMGESAAPGTRRILVDTSTDLRAQALANNINRLDAVLFTHSHADHIHGLDEVRRYNMVQKVSMPVYGDEQTLADLRASFRYIFNTPGDGWGVPQLTLFRIGGPFMLGRAEIIPVPIMHGSRPILGFRIGTFAYLTDCSGIPDTTWPLLEGVKTFVVDALRDRPHPTHFSVSQALDAVKRVSPDRAYFTHICHDLPHVATCARLPAGVELAYDGLVLDC